MRLAEQEVKIPPRLRTKAKTTVEKSVPLVMFTGGFILSADDKEIFFFFFIKTLETFENSLFTCKLHVMQSIFTGVCSPNLSDACQPCQGGTHMS